MREFVAMLGSHSFGTEYMFDFMVGMLTAYDPGEHSESNTVLKVIEDGWMPMVTEHREWRLSNPNKSFDGMVSSLELSTVAWVSVLDTLVNKLHEADIDNDEVFDEIGRLRFAAISHLRHAISEAAFEKVEKLF
jgi:hypothetical protein